MSDGIIIKVEQGDKKIEIKIGKDVNPEQLKVVQKVLEKLAESSQATGNSKTNRSSTRGNSSSGGPTRFFKVKTIISKYFSKGHWFTSIDLRELYEETYGEALGATTASTYLRRLESEGILESRKRGKILEYRVINQEELEMAHTMVNQGNEIQ
ncbi:MAG: hypothetical protein ACP6IP_09410 [Candidatus Njordarchaeia archaeon]